MRQNGRVSSRPQRPVIGAPAPPVELETAHGDRWRLDDQRGRPVVMIFHRHIH